MSQLKILFNEEIRGAKFLWSLVGLLSVLSVLAVYSASVALTKYNMDSTVFMLFRHLPFVITGLFIVWYIGNHDYIIFNRMAPFMLLLAIMLLVFALFGGVSINSARRWINIPILNITFQVSDFAKIALITYLARSIAAKQEIIKDFKTAFVPILLPVLIICGLIAPSNFSTAAILFVCSVIMLIVGRIKMKYILLLLALGIVLLGLLVYIGQFLPDTVRVTTWVKRISDFINPSAENYQAEQARIAIARGSFFGAGPGKSMLRHFIPYSYADFIFAIVCEEYGLVGAVLLIILYMALMWHCILIVKKSPKAFGSILTIGLGFSIVMQAFANMAVSLGLVPVTGQTLPYISMGGTSLLFTSLAFGMIVSVSKHINSLTLERSETAGLQDSSEDTNAYEDHH
ncbi:MAG: FtsW/RodA/SpoVE family cell cycle protein [Saprospiraceae bacterium]|nr:FtsW/RodA/SpoVE family cell cycle protein [Saprospiraceae bacterium]HMW40393.1 FtsW/RodA/SpoVE family cell cycle protein [Saprospiraceae bacterium]HMX89254.1 FtsW/RodA/SpoVE family cell cycle protein [Saprospiraceae bacterium]HMZ41171.1 FtsW/RodA/SpoVE family cell cycle protein [Saprospiraceae bacterium]HNA65057.1 FtsW/RodA/SpoVE family cell cycle protein [Saprospiraceae bacterium]